MSGGEDTAPGGAPGTAGPRRWLRAFEDGLLGISLLLMAVIPVVEFFGRRWVGAGIPGAADYLRRDSPDSEESSASEGHSLVRDEADSLQIVAEDDAVSRYMASAVQSIAANASLLDAARAMCGAHIHHLPVIENERVVGIVSTMDIVAAVVNAVDEADARGPDI